MRKCWDRLNSSAVVRASWGVACVAFSASSSCAAERTQNDGATAPELQRSVADGRSGASWRDYYRDRTAARFEWGILVKPGAPATGVAELDQLAPLFIWAHPNGRKEPTLGLPIARDPAERRKIDPRDFIFPERRVFYDRSELAVGGERFEQIIFSFQFGSPQSSRIPDRMENRDYARVTVGLDGFPLTWEIIDDSGIDRVFVAKSAEAAAARRHGGALEGRRFAVEPGAPEQRRYFVAGLFADGPIPMGPYLYVDFEGRHRGSADIANVACRCSAMQADDLYEESAEYELEPIESLWAKLSWGCSVEDPSSFPTAVAADYRRRLAEANERLVQLRLPVFEDARVAVPGPLERGASENGAGESP